MFPKLVYKVILLIISMSSTDLETINADFFFDNNLAGKYQIHLNNSKWEITVEETQYSFTVFEAVQTGEDSFRILFSDASGKPEYAMMDIGEITEQMGTDNIMSAEQEILLNDEQSLIISRSAINTYFTCPLESWHFIVPNDAFRSPEYQ